VRTLGETELHVSTLCLGGNVFGWTADEQESFAVLDAFMDAGGNIIDTADAYSAWISGHTGGESETIIGRWLKTHGRRDRIVVATKVGRLKGLEGLGPSTIRAGVEGSLRRLQTDHIDLYYAHADDPNTPLEDTLRTFDAIVREGKVRHIAASNYSAPRLADALAVSRREGLTRYVALQPHYNLMHRDEYEGDLRDLCARERIACAPYFALAKGFLSGKYRGSTPVESVRAAGASVYLNERGHRVLGVLDRVATAHETTVPAVALAWLAAQPTIVAPIASARTVDQLRELLPAMELRLANDELSELAAA
jgi:aryl-alcohol dehydrogenase-like predicted oxidoreductase